MSPERAPRLPGFRFETQAPPLPEVLPRMDIAAFVGFAASGPLHMPVAIGSEVQFTAIYGDDAKLAWDVEKGEQVQAHLGPAVRAFFRNGGQRCWVIRIARDSVKRPGDLNRARYNHFPIPGLARAAFGGGGKNLKRIAPGFARARSEGSWCDSLKVSAAMLARSLQIISLKIPHQGSPPNQSDRYIATVDLVTARSLSPGDLLKLTFEDRGVDRYVLYFPVDEIKEAKRGSPPSTTTVDLITTRGIWFEIVNAPSLLPGGVVKAVSFTREAASEAEDIIDVLEGGATWNAVLNPHLISPPQAATPGIPDSGSQTLMLKLLNCDVVDTPQVGTLLRINAASGTFWLTVAGLSFSSGEAAAFVWGNAFKEIQTPPAIADKPDCECLTFELWVRKGEEYSVNLSDLRFAPGHERYWGALPTDEEVYSDIDPPTDETPATMLWRQVGDLFRFPLAGINAPNDFYFPLSMPAVANSFLGPVKLNGSALERDGLAEFDAGLFLDAGLIESQTGDLSSNADYLMYLAPKPRRLHGMHAVIPIEEATLIAVPDAVHRSWFQQAPTGLSDPDPSPPPLRPEWWHFLDCHSASSSPLPSLDDCDPQPAVDSSPIKAVHEPEWGEFLDCSIKIIKPPVLVASSKVSPDGNFNLTWKASGVTNPTFILEESGIKDFSDATTIFSGSATNYTLYGRKPGDYFYRVRTLARGNSSDWSNGVAVRVGASTNWTINAEKDYSSDTLLAIQRSLLRLSAARGDLFSILSLPEHFREDAAIEHLALLKATPDIAPFTERVSPLGFGEANDFSYGAVFHPWPIEREESRRDQLLRMPPCGAITGVIADRTLGRGAWMAPANEPLRGVVALEPALNPIRRLALQEARINLIRQEPRGFLVLDADTLAADQDLRLINVRRLLILLRRQALRLGATYVFEPNSPAFRRMVDRGFSEMLDGMFERGAFAGDTPSQSYQVVTDASLNTAAGVDAGRFVVELRVAPSAPMSFLTIRLIQTSERSLAMEVR